MGPGNGLGNPQCAGTHPPAGPQLELIPRFETDIRRLESVTGEDFDDWLGPRGGTGGLVGARPHGQRQARNGVPRSL